MKHSDCRDGNSLPLQLSTPLLSALLALVNRVDAPFYSPGHKRGVGIGSSLADFWGNAVFQSDLPELPELDNLFAPQGVIHSAQVLAAEAFGAEQTWFLINGSSCGIVAAILATCKPGEKIILPRNIHRSVVSGLILSGAVPVFIAPEYNPSEDLIYSISPSALAKTLAVNRDARAVMVVYPTYQGICGDIEALIRITHAYNLPFLVDEAHGAHLAFHPDLPPSALSLGADLSVQSTHKVLGSLSQASMVHLQGDRLDGHRLSQALQLLQTTSPSYILLASLDAARQQMALQGFDLMQRTLDLAQRAREELLLLPYLAVLSLPQPLEGFRWLDNTRLTIGVEKLGLTGYQVDEILRTQFHVTCELPLLRHLTFIVSIGNTASDIERLIDAFTHLSASSPLGSIFPPLPPLGALCLSPREAFLAPTQTVKLAESFGKVSAELICPYPPGIPILIPGEVITQEAIAYLQILIHQGAVITGCSDSSLETVKICNN